ncbi:MerR family transcriptional regulator [Muricoccus radiodurans]|uniref:MerR family transcriptional regulator n=1 Tax=Muricoccus radiodurans TaxID=2231721 RepID=UPI003CF9E8AB
MPSKLGSGPVLLGTEVSRGLGTLFGHGVSGAPSLAEASPPDHLHVLVSRDFRAMLQSSGLVSIGELSRLTGVKVTTIRWYESEGWLPPPARTEGGHRAYNQDQLRRLGFIRHARELGFSMDAIRSLLRLADSSGTDCSVAHSLATAQIQEVDARIARLEALRGELSRMAENCAGGDVGDCRILETLADFEHGHCANRSHRRADLDRDAR